MRRTHVLVGLAVSAAVCFAGSSSSFADQSSPGVPLTKNCKGQTTAFVAQGNARRFLVANGIGNVADVNNVDVKVVQAFIDRFCANLPL